MVPHTIEQARTGRSKCRGCGQPIPKGEPRLGVAHAQENGGHSYQWLHLRCAVTHRLLELEQALAETKLAIPDRATLDRDVAAALRQRPVLPTPRAVAGQGLDTFHCHACGAWSFPSTLRVLVPVTIQAGGRALQREAELHPKCAKNTLGDPDLLNTLLRNSPGLSADAEQWLRDDLA